MVYHLLARIPFEAPECDTYEENKRELINYGLKLLHLSQDSSVVSESKNQEAMLSIVSIVYCACKQLSFFCTS